MFTVARLAVNAIASLGVATVFDGLIKQNIVPKSVLHKRLISIGTFVLGGVVVDRAVDHLNKAISGVITEIKSLRNKDEKPTEE